MKKKHTLAAGLAAVWLMAGTALAQVCNPNIPVTAPDSRYTDNGDGTVTDQATGLMWKQCAEGLSGAGCGTGVEQNFTWQQAMQQGNSQSFAGHSDWRLPNNKELASLVEGSCVDPVINLTRFPNASSSGFWSSSPDADGSGGAWIVYFGYGSVGNYGRDFNYAVRMVRDGQ